MAYCKRLSRASRGSVSCEVSTSLLIAASNLYCPPRWILSASRLCAGILCTNRCSGVRDMSAKIHYIVKLAVLFSALRCYLRVSQDMSIPSLSVFG